MLNHIIVMGRLTRDPELRYTQSQTPVCSFSVACERDIAGQGQDRETDFIDCVAWRGTGEFVSKYFAKGAMIAVSGRLQGRKWTDRDGNKRTSMEILVGHAYFCESKRDGDGERRAQTERTGGFTPARGPVDVGYGELSDADGELLF